MWVDMVVGFRLRPLGYFFDGQTPLGEFKSLNVSSATDATPRPVGRSSPLRGRGRLVFQAARLRVSLYLRQKVRAVVLQLVLPYPGNSD